MSKIDRWPSTPMKLVTQWAMSVIFFIASMFVMWMNRVINDTVFYVLAGYLFGTDLNTVVQFIGKRKTAFAASDADPDAPVITKSEAVKTKGSGQPAVPAPYAAAAPFPQPRPAPGTAAAAEEVGG